MSKIVILDDGYEIDPLDMYYPRQRWTAKWSDGGNIPLGLLLLAEWRAVMPGVPDFYERGLWLFSKEGHGVLASEGTEINAGWTCLAYTRGHARHIFKRAATPA